MSIDAKEEKQLENLRESAQRLIQEIDDYLAKVSMHDYGVKALGGEVNKFFSLYCHQKAKAK